MTEIDRAGLALEAVRRAVEINDGDTLARLEGDNRVIWIASGSWTGSASVTLGDLRALASLRTTTEARGGVWFAATAGQSEPAYPESVCLELSDGSRWTFHNRVAAPQPASVAGKMPSEEDRRVIAQHVARLRDDARNNLRAAEASNNPDAAMTFRAFAAAKTGAADAIDRALLSPAEPHEGDAGEDDLGHDTGSDGDGLVERLREAGSNRVRPASGYVLDSSDALLLLEAADHIEAQGREIAELTEALEAVRDRIIEPKYGGIDDTFWMSDIETVVDYINAALDPAARLVDEEGRR